jgi:hypothetical protein
MILGESADSLIGAHGAFCHESPALEIEAAKKSDEITQLRHRPAELAQNQAMHARSRAGELGSAPRPRSRAGELGSDRTRWAA